MVYGYEKTVLTDHLPLISLFANTLPPGRLGRWCKILQEYNIQFKYKPGSLNRVPDALSRHPIPLRLEEEVDVDEGPMAITVVTPQINQVQTWMKNSWTTEELKKEQSKDEDFGEIYKWLVNNKQDGAPKKIPNGLDLRKFFLENQVLHYENFNENCAREGQVLTRLVIPSSMAERIIKMCHEPPYMGHRGVEATIKRIRERYLILGLRQLTLDMRQKCEKCHQHRGEPEKHGPGYQYPVVPKPFY